MTFDVRDLPIVGVAFVLLGCVVFGVVIEREIHHQAEAAELVSHTLNVMLQLERIETGLAAAESELRGNGLTGDPAFLDDFVNDVVDTRTGFEETRLLTADNPLQQERLDALEPILTERLALITTHHQAMLSGGSPVPAPKARVLTRQIRDAVAEMRNAELELLAQRRVIAGERTRTLVWRCRLAMLSSVGIGLAALAWIARERRIRLRIEEELAGRRSIVDAILEGTTDAVFAKDIEGRYLMMNTAGARFLGHTVPEVVGKRDVDLFTEDSAQSIAERDMEILRAGAARTFEATSTANGITRTYLSTRAPFRNVEGRVVGLVGISRDITDRKASEDLRFREMTLLLELAELLQACKSTVDAYDVIGRMGARLFPQVSGAVSLIHPSRNLVELRSSWGPEMLVDGAGLFGPDDCWALRRGRAHVAEGDYGMACRHGASKGATCCTPLLAQGEVLGVLHLGADGIFDESVLRRAAFVAEQISMAIANLELRETLRTQSIRDPLTGLYNRRFAEDTLRRELLRAARQHGTLATLSMDLDHFKRINDTFGHDAGDRVLRDVGAVLMDSTQGDDVASRMGGEELLVVLPGVSAEEAWRKAEVLRARIAALDLVRDGVRIGPVSVSIGIAMYPAHGTAVDALLRAGDTALYAAKRGGRNRVVWADVPSGALEATAAI